MKNEKVAKNRRKVKAIIALNFRTFLLLATFFIFEKKWLTLRLPMNI
jgi:hypothetical protein